MKHQSRHLQKQEQEVEQQSRHQAAREFENPEELLRFDAAQTTVPPEVALRLQNSAVQIPPPEPRPWWKKIFRR